MASMISRAAYGPPMRSNIQPLMYLPPADTQPADADERGDDRQRGTPVVEERRREAEDDVAHGAGHRAGHEGHAVERVGEIGPERAEQRRRGGRPVGLDQVRRDEREKEREGSRPPEHPPPHGLAGVGREGGEGEAEGVGQPVGRDRPPTGGGVHPADARQARPEEQPAADPDHDLAEEQREVGPRRARDGRADGQRQRGGADDAPVPRPIPERPADEVEDADRGGERGDRATPAARPTARGRRG